MKEIVILRPLDKSTVKCVCCLPQFEDEILTRVRVLYQLVLDQRIVLSLEFKFGPVVLSRSTLVQIQIGVTGLCGTRGAQNVTYLPEFNDEFLT